MANTIWNQWYYQDRFLGKPYPFINNYPKPNIEKDCVKKEKPKKKSKLEKKFN
jgi:hypothetical protein